MVKSGSCLIDQAAARLKSGRCLIDQDLVREKSTLNRHPINMLGYGSNPVTFCEPIYVSIDTFLFLCFIDGV